MNKEINYSMEELVPIVGRLAEKYTSCESTSISYEKAEQLMEAVLYCIHEIEIYGNHALVSDQGLSAEQAYRAGRACVEEKVKKALAIYHDILPKFSSYGNEYLNHALTRGLPKFFQNYDIRFAPQEMILTLDYPVLKDISAYTGIDRVYAWILCIQMEQKFLSLFPEEYVCHVLSKYDRQYRQTAENICAPVLASVLKHLLAGKPLSEFDLGEDDNLRIKEIFRQNKTEEISGQLKRRIKAFIEKYFGINDAMKEYLLGSVNGLVLRLENAAEN